MFCKNLPLERMNGSAAKKIICFQEKSKYLVLDAGGRLKVTSLHRKLCVLITGLIGIFIKRSS